MADILLVDSNPEHVRALDGIVKYRTRHQIEVVPDCVQALRCIHTKRPDFIMINVLLYSSEEYGFARALAESPEHASIPVAAHLSGHIGDLTRRRIEAMGARLLELPITADEIEEELARPVKVKSSGIETVTWAKAQPAATTSNRPKRDSKPSQQKAEVRSVNWAVDGSSGEAAAKPAFRTTQPKTSTRAAQKKASRQVSKPRPTASNSASGFAPLAEKTERVENPAEFVPGARWKKVEPEQVKNRHRSTRRS